MVESAAIIVLFFGGIRALKWMLDRCDKRTDDTLALVADLTDALDVSNKLEERRQARHGG